MYHHSTTDIQTDNMAYERNRLQLYQQFLQLLLQIAQREEAQQLPDIPRPRRRRRPARRRVWCRTWLARRTLFGQYDHLLHELNREDPASYRNFLRVDADLFGQILDRVTPAIKKESTSFRYSFRFIFYLILVVLLIFDMKLPLPLHFK